MTTAGFSGASVRIARVFNRLTQAELADAVSVSVSMIWQIENGREPSSSVLAAIALVLGFEIDFFYQRVEGEFTEAECYFRRRVTAAQRIRKQVLARGTLFGMVVRRLGEILVLPDYNIPMHTCVVPGEIEDAAGDCRERWGLGKQTPIVNMARVLEHAGVFVTRLEDAREAAKLDAFSRAGAKHEPSVVVLNTAKSSSSRSRFDMAHELGHLVMHRQVSITQRDREAQADWFAGAFLLPRDGFARDFWYSGRINWGRLFEMKRRWKVSLAAMIVRAHQLGLIDVVEYRRGYKRLSQRGWLKGEPNEPEGDRPELFSKAMRTLWERKGVGVADVAASLYWTVPTFEKVTGWQPDEPDTSDGVLSLVGGGNVKRRVGSSRQAK